MREQWFTETTPVQVGPVVMYGFMRTYVVEFQTIMRGVMETFVLSVSLLDAPNQCGVLLRRAFEAYPFGEHIRWWAICT